VANRVSYSALFSIECWHGYFADGVCRTLALHPTGDAAALCQRHHLRFRSSPGAGTVYYDELSTNLRRLRSETSPLTFALTSTDPYFDIYTDGSGVGDAVPNGTVRYFGNRDVHVAEVGGGQYRLLHPPDQPLAQPPLPVRPRQFTHRFDVAVRGVSVQVLNASGGVVWQSRTPDVDMREHAIDLRDQPCGRYRLAIADQPFGDFYLTDAPAARLWGVVEVFLENTEEVPRYAISFASRATFWRYYIFDAPTPASPYGGYDVVGLRKRPDKNASSNGDIRFARGSEVVTVNGRPAFVFESTQTVPLAEVPGGDDYAFTFRPNGSSERGGQSIRLPFAQPVATRPDARPDGVRMVSDIFVYL